MINYLKPMITFLLTLYIFIGLSCDDRLPEEVDQVVNGTLEIVEVQPVCCFDSDSPFFGVEVGEVVSGYTMMKLLVTLRDEGGVLQKGKTVTFSDNIGSSSNDLDYFLNGVSMTTDDNGEVLQYYNPNSSIEKLGNDLAKVTVKYGSSNSSSVEFKIYNEKTDVWPYRLILNAEPENIKLDNGLTTANIEARLFNNQDPSEPVSNVRIDYNSSKGFLNQTSDTTDNAGITNLVFSDNGIQQDIGTASIICNYTHPGFNESIAETINVDIGSQNNLTLEITPVSASGSSQIIVGEDIVGSISRSRIIATVLDTSGNPKIGQAIAFTAMVLGESVGQIIVNSNLTDNQGQVYAYFDDSGDPIVDILGTSEYEGVTLTAYLGDSTSSSFTNAQFNVYPETVWPYTLIMNSDVDAILLDNGETVASLETQIRNQNLDPVQNVTISFISDKGIIEPVGTTNNDGIISLTFSDNGTQDDIGLANIVGSFNHPGFSSSVLDSVQISITTNNGISHEVIPISYDENGATIIVGEDVSGQTASSLLVATVLDSLNAPVTGIPVEFEALSNGQEVGSISYLNEYSNSDGQVIGIFDDNGNVYKDNPGTPNYEGVSVIAKFGDKTTEPINFNVYPDEDVWPYSLVLDSDTDVISLDGGVTSAQISIRLLNRLGNPVEGAQISYVSTLGFIAATGFTDSLGADTVAFTDLGNPNDIGVSDIYSSFSHPGFEGVLIQDSLQVYIEDPSFQSCAYMEIPASIPGNIVVRDGGGLESTFIRAEVYDDNGNLMDTPTPVVFTMEPMVGDAYLEDTPGQTTATLFTVNGVATVSINSGTEPGPVRIVATCDCDQDGAVDLTVVDVPVIISSGAPYSIEAEYDPNSTTAIGGGFYQTEIAAVVSDIHGNPVEDSAYVYWNIAPKPPAVAIDAVVEGVSFKNNTPPISTDPYSGVAYSHIIYSTDAIGAVSQIRALTWGADWDEDGVGGDSVYSYINEGEGDATLFFLPGQVSLLASQTYWDFSLNPSPATITVSALVIDYYGNPVKDAPVAFNGTGVNAWVELGYEPYTDEAILTDPADGCFSWRDYGADDDPETLDQGTFNDKHDSFDLDGDGIIDTSEVSEPFQDFGQDGIDGTFDEGEGNGYWDGYSMIDCEPVVLTDQDGYARIIVQFTEELCTLANVDDTTDPSTCTYDDFTASLSATLLIPEITTSDPLDILLVRSPAPCP